MSCVEKLHDFSILILFLTVVVVAMCAWMDRSASALLLGIAAAPLHAPPQTLQTTWGKFWTLTSWVLRQVCSLPHKFAQLVYIPWYTSIEVLKWRIDKMCLFSSLLAENLESHKSHLDSFLPSCTFRKWFFKLWFVVKLFPHVLQVIFLFPSWIVEMCEVKPVFNLKAL